MTNSDINNHFGDMDLYLMDAILKGHIPEEGKVLDIGCGEGRNGIYFIKGGYSYHGIDHDRSKIRLLEYLSETLEDKKLEFTIGSIQESVYGKYYDLVIASRILHFVNSLEEFRNVLNKISASLKSNGILYFAMDSAIVESLVQKQNNGKYEFHDGRISFCLTEYIYDEILSEFDEIEELRTLVYSNKRVQSFALLRKH